MWSDDWHLNCAILSIASQPCHLHLCLVSFFNAFLVMFTTQSVQSCLNSSAPINSAFWSCCHLFFPHLLRFRIRVKFVALIYSFYFSPTYPIADAMQNSAFNLLGYQFMAGVAMSIYMLQYIFAILCYAKVGANSSTVTSPPAQLRRRLIRSNSCPDNGVDVAVVCVPSTKCRGLLGLVPVATMTSSAPWLPLLHNSEAAAASVGISPVFNFIWLATFLTAPWLPLLPNSEAATASVGISTVFNTSWSATFLTTPWWPLKPPLKPLAWLGDRNSTDSGQQAMPMEFFCDLGSSILLKSLS